MKKILQFIILAFFSFVVLSSCSYSLNKYMDEYDPPRIFPDLIDLGSEHWYMYGYNNGDSGLCVDYAIINWTESKNATKYEIYYYSSEKAVSFDVAQERCIYLESEKESGEHKISFKEKNIILDYDNNYTYITVIPVTEQYIKKSNKTIENKGKPLTRWWKPRKLVE